MCENDRRDFLQKGHSWDRIEAIRTGRQAGSNFDYGGPLTQVALLGIIALDDELNVFVRDSENDWGNLMIRVSHSFMGAEHGYPYLYQEHPEGLENGLTDTEFVDLIAFLAEQK